MDITWITLWTLKIKMIVIKKDRYRTVAKTSLEPGLSWYLTCALTNIAKPDNFACH